MDKREYMNKKHQESLRSDAVNRQEAEQSFRNLYRALGWQEPQVLWAQSPMGAAFLAGFMILLETTPDLSSPDPVWERPKVDLAMERQTAVAIWQSMLDALPVLQDLAKGAGTKMQSKDVRSKPSPANTTVRRIARHLQEIARRNQDSVDASGDELWLADVVTRAAHPGADEVWARLLAGISEASWEFMYGSHDISWLGHYEYEEQHENRKVSPELAALIETSRHTGWWISMDDFVVASERHLSISFDNNDRLHGEGGPCATYPDGWSVYAYHNVRIEPEDAWIIEQPERITVQDIRDEDNQELRRIKLQLMGLDKYLQNADATLVDDQYPRWGKLWRAPLPGSTRGTGDLWMVQVRNSTPEPDGSYKDYFLQVDPNGYDGEVSRNAHAAVAWTWVDDETGEPIFKDWREYAPAQET